VSISLPAQKSPSSVQRIADLITSDLSIDADTRVGDVVRVFEANPELDALAVLDGGAPPRMVSRSRLLLQLGRRFGYALFENRPIRLLAEEGSPVEADADPVEVITLASRREATRIYDDILVVERGRYTGLVSMRSLLAHHKDLLVTSMAEVAVLDEKTRTLEQINRVQSEFVANMTHELRSPLNTILGVVRIMMGDAEMPGGHLRHLGLVAERGQELLSIINNLLDLSKIEAGAMTPIFEQVELRPLFEDLLHSTEPLVGTKPVRLEARLEGLPRTFRTDPVFVRRIVSNLLSNAVKFTDAGAVALAAEGDRDAIVIRVSDSGIGIRAEEVERLFRKFTQLEATKTKRHAGTGLGLAIVKGLVEELNGSVSVETQQGSGTTFSVRLSSAREPSSVQDLPGEGAKSWR